MRRIYNENCRKVAHGSGYTWQHPNEIHLGREAYDTYEAELLANERFVSWTVRDGEESLMFKGAVVRPVGVGWTMRIAA